MAKPLKPRKPSKCRSCREAPAVIGFRCGHCYAAMLKKFEERSRKAKIDVKEARYA